MSWGCQTGYLFGPSGSGWLTPSGLTRWLLCSSLARRQVPGVREDLLHTCKPHKKKTPHTACRRTHTCESKHCGQAGKRCPDARTAWGKFERRKVWNRTTEAEFVIFDDFNLFSRGASVRYVWVLVNAKLSLMIHACIKDTLELGFFLFF